jgi:hypothetical protein
MTHLHNDLFSQEPSETEMQSGAPCPGGHSVEITIDAGDIGRIPLFAVRIPAFDVTAPTLARFNVAKAVYWQTGSLAYALTVSRGGPNIELGSALLDEPSNSRTAVLMARYSSNRNSPGHGRRRR